MWGVSGIAAYRRSHSWARMDERKKAKVFLTIKCVQLLLLIVAGPGVKAVVFCRPTSSKVRLRLFIENAKGCAAACTYDRYSF